MFGEIPTIFKYELKLTLYLAFPAKKLSSAELFSSTVS